MPIEYIITPEKGQGDITVSKLPCSLKVRQFGLASYPARELYSIDFNRIKLANKIRAKAIATNENLSDAAIQARVNDFVDDLQKRMPFTITIERNIDDKEDISIIGITDRNGSDLSDSCMEIHIQSLGVDEDGGGGQYWLDTGAFNF